MLKSRHREKLINAAIYFAANTRHCGKIKLIKLLYLLDFEHFRQTGASVTGLEYRAMKMGPVPMDLYQEWDALEADFADGSTSFRKTWSTSSASPCAPSATSTMHTSPSVSCA